MAEKITITLRGQNYTIISDEPASKLCALADSINAKLDEIMASGRLSLNQGLVLAALDFANEASLKQEENDKLRNEIGDYLEDAEKAMTERDRYKRENEKLKEKLKK